MAQTPHLDALRWYETRSNNGRGRLDGESAKLLKLGLLTLAWTSQVCWVLTLSDKGRKFLERYKEIA